MLLIPAGEFDMGSQEAEEGRDKGESLHRVRITRAYWLARTEVTQAVWEAVMGANPSTTKGPTRPVTDVSWNDCQAFLQRMNERVAGGRFRLPAEAEWEYACRAGTRTRYWSGEAETDLARVGWYDLNSGGHTHAVGEKPASPWGLFDMHGNVAEWCADVWHDDYVGAPTDGRPWVSGDSDERVLRGGAWRYGAAVVRSASRDGFYRPYGNPVWGFRLARDAASEFPPSPIPGGAPPAPPPNPGDPAPPFAPRGGGTEDRAVVLRFVLDLAPARREGRIAPEDRDPDVLATTVRVVETRLERYGRQALSIVLVGDDRFEVVVPPGVDAEGIKEVVSATGDVQFRIEVRPSYPEFRDDRGEGRKRDQVWVGATGAPAPPGAAPETFGATSDGFERFKAREVERWNQARDRGESYVPLDARYRLVPVETSGRTAPSDFVVVEEPRKPEERMGARILTNVRPAPDSDGNPSVHFDVKAESQRAFSDWTGANVGLPMAIVLDGEYHSAPIIRGRLTDSVVITLGGGEDVGPMTKSRFKRLRERQMQLVAVLQSGSLVVAPRFEAQRTVGPSK